MTTTKQLWAGRILTGIPMFLLCLDGAMKLIAPREVVLASAKIGFGASALPLMGAVEIASVLLLSFRRTAILGAVLITAYLGGAVASHVRLGDPLFTHLLAPIYVAIAIWGGLYLRDNRVRALSPFTKGTV